MHLCPYTPRRHCHGVGRGQPLTDPSPDTMVRICSPFPDLVASCCLPSNSPKSHVFFFFPALSFHNKHFYLIIMQIWRVETGEDLRWENLRCENRTANRSASRETGLKMPCYPVNDLLWVQITQSYPNRLRFSSFLIDRCVYWHSNIQCPYKLVLGPQFRLI